MRIGDLDALKDRFSLTGPIGVSVRKVIDKQPTIDADPCTFCAYNPPSSCDGKPCCYCPATPKRKDGEG